MSICSFGRGLVQKEALTKHKIVLDFRDQGGEALPVCATAPPGGGAHYENGPRDLPEAGRVKGQRDFLLSGQLGSIFVDT